MLKPNAAKKRINGKIIEQNVIYYNHRERFWLIYDHWKSRLKIIKPIN